jgi:hypothetical protein
MGDTAVDSIKQLRWGGIGTGEERRVATRMGVFKSRWGAEALTANSAMGLEFEFNQSVSDTERIILHKTILACANPFDR